MAYKRNVTEQEREKWKAQTEEQHEYLKGLVANLAESYRQDPEQIAEVLAFSSRFYQYSVRNTMLIYGQNEHATYVQSFQAWKRMGASVKKGEKGLKVYVPVQATLLKIEDKLVPLEYATKEQKARYHAGEIESVTKQRFKIGNVFHGLSIRTTSETIGSLKCLCKRRTELSGRSWRSEIHCIIWLLSAAG